MQCKLLREEVSKLRFLREEVVKLRKENEQLRAEQSPSGKPSGHLKKRPEKSSEAGGSTGRQSRRPLGSQAKVDLRVKEGSMTTSTKRLASPVAKEKDLSPSRLDPAGVPSVTPRVQPTPAKTQSTGREHDLSGSRLNTGDVHPLVLCCPY